MTVRTRLPADFRHDARLAVVGASAGGIEALFTLFDGLGAIDVPVVVVLHLPEERESLLASIIAARCRIPVTEAGDKEPIEAGRLYTAPPGYHLLVENDMSFSLNCDPPVRFSRPSIDVLMASAADAAGAGLVCALLTGANDDGARGLAQARAAGALTVVQDPDEAQVADMPSAAIARAAPSYILPLADIRRLLTRLEFADA